MYLDWRYKAALGAREAAYGDAERKEVDFNHVLSIEEILSGTKIV